MEFAVVLAEVNAALRRERYHDNKCKHSSCLDLGMFPNFWYTLLSSNCTSTSKALSSSFFSSFSSTVPITQSATDSNHDNIITN